MKKGLLILILLFFYYDSFSQRNELSFERFSRTKSKGYKVKIQESETELLIIFKLIDSISNNIEKDKSYIKQNKKIDRFQTSKKAQDLTFIKPTIIKQNEIEEKYFVCKTDSLVINKGDFIEYYNSFSEILVTPIEILENKKNTRIVLDGHFVTFIMRTKNHEDISNLNSPNERSHPILIKFLKNSFDLYRKEKNNDFLNKEYTFEI